jgi:sec-independent protein translocase protein TatB
MFDIGFQELIIIFVVALLVIGPEKLPEFSKKLRKWVEEIRKGINIAKSQIEEEINKDIKISETTTQSLQEDVKSKKVISDTNVSEGKS